MKKVTDDQCFQCTRLFGCDMAFKNICDQDGYERAWGTCRKCSRIVSPEHSNCPNCGNREIKPIMEKQREKLKRKIPNGKSEQL